MFIFFKDFKKQLIKKKIGLINYLAQIFCFLLLNHRIKKNELDDFLKSPPIEIHYDEEESPSVETVGVQYEEEKDYEQTKLFNENSENNENESKIENKNENKEEEDEEEEDDENIVFIRKSTSSTSKRQTKKENNKKI